MADGQLGGGPLMGHNTGTGYSNRNPGVIDEDARKKWLEAQAAKKAANAPINPTGQINPGGAGSNQAQMDYFKNHPANAPQPGVTDQTTALAGAAQVNPGGVDSNTAKMDFYNQNSELAPLSSGKTVESNPAPVQNTNAVTPVGQIYADRLLAGLQGDDKISKNIQATEDTNAARRQYLARKATEETLGQTHFQPGSAQYQRAMTESQAGVNRLNLEGQAQAYGQIRQRTGDLSNEAQAYETQQYGRGIAQQAKTDADATRLAGTLPEGAAKNEYNRLVANGMSPKDAFNAVMETGTGAVKEQFRGPTDFQAIKKDAEEWVTGTTGLKPGDKGYVEAVNARLVELDKAKRVGVTNTVKDADLQSAREAMNKGGELNSTQIGILEGSGDIPVFKAGTAIDMNKIKDAKLIRIGDQYYNVGETKTQGGGTGAVSAITSTPGTVKNADGSITQTFITDKNGKQYYVNGGKLYPMAEK